MFISTQYGVWYSSVHSVGVYHSRFNDSNSTPAGFYWPQYTLQHITYIACSSIAPIIIVCIDKYSCMYNVYIIMCISGLYDWYYLFQAPVLPLLVPLLGKFMRNTCKMHKIFVMCSKIIIKRANNIMKNTFLKIKMQLSSFDWSMKPLK